MNTFTKIIKVFYYLVVALFLYVITTSAIQYFMCPTYKILNIKNYMIDAFLLNFIQC